MTLRVLHVVIDCGRRTCVNQDNKPCQFLRNVMPMITGPTCRLFDKDLCADDQRDNGEIQRCDECMGRER